MTSSTFHDFVLEYQSEGIGNALYAFIWGVVESVTRRYPPAAYSPNGVWDEDAISGLCNDFIVGKLLGDGWIEHYLMSLENESQLRGALQRDFRHFLINRHKRGEFQNLVHRLKQMLTGSLLFKACGSTSNASVWGLREWDHRAQVQQVEEVVRAMYSVSLPPLTHYKAASRKASHLISNEDLQRLLVGALKHLDGCVALDLLVEALRYRLNLHEITTVSLDEPTNTYHFDGATFEDIIPAPTDIEDWNIAEAARQIFDDLTDRQKRTLSAFLASEKPTLEAVGKKVGVSKSAVDNDLKDIQQKVALTELTEQEAEKLFAQLSILCAEQVE